MRFKEHREICDYCGLEELFDRMTTICIEQPVRVVEKYDPRFATAFREQDQVWTSLCRACIKTYITPIITATLRRRTNG
jgi:hypothetical protein